MLTGTNIAQLLTGFTLDYKWICIMGGKLLQARVIVMDLLKLLLSLLDFPGQLAIRPRLSQRTEQEGQANQAGDPDDGLRKKRAVPGPQPAYRLLHTYRWGHMLAASLWTRGEMGSSGLMVHGTSCHPLLNG